MRNTVLLIALAVIAINCNKKVTKPPVIVTTTTTTQQTIPIPDDPVPIIVPDKPPVKIPDVPNINDTIFFDFDRDELRPESLDKLNRISGLIKTCHVSALRLVGGACPIGDELYNYRLGLRRGESAKEVLLSKNPGLKILLLSKGETDLVTEKKADYWRNRNCIISNK